MTKPSWLVALAFLAACASAPTKPVPAPAAAGKALMYALPAPNAATYTFADSSSFDIQGGAIGDIHATIGTAGVADVSYAQKGAALEATIRVVQFAGSMTNSAATGGPSATEKEIDGAAVITVSGRGAPRITMMPKLTPLIQQLGMGEAFYRRLFVRLPAMRVKPGATWADTLSGTDSTANTKTTYRDIVTGTFVRDSVVNGRSLAYITTSAQRSLHVSGTNQGVQIAQTLSGFATSNVLWDADRKLLVDRREHTELSGTFDLPSMNVTGLPVTAHGNGHLALR